MAQAFPENLLIDLTGDLLKPLDHCRIRCPHCGAVVYSGLLRSIRKARNPVSGLLDRCTHCGGTYLFAGTTQDPLGLWAELTDALLAAGLGSDEPGSHSYDVNRSETQQLCLSCAISVASISRRSPRKRACRRASAL